MPVSACDIGFSCVRRLHCEIQAMWRRIWTEWFPTSGYESVEGVQFEMYYGLASHEHVFGVHFVICAS
ncbi:MAG: GyrI-like domain-containing protein [Clostridiaceae bacterium]|nr:GyrI-like domain-containing protein [Clostridiaceae bacterium]